MRRVPLWLGLGTLATAWLGPLPRQAVHAFSAHMTLHMLVVAVAAPLLAIAVAKGRWDPVPHAPRLFSPVPASLVELMIVWVWHAPALHHFARHTTVGLIFEQATFVASGLLVWMAAFGGRGQSARTGAGIVALLLTSMHMTLLGALLALADRPLFHHGGTSAEALSDQHVGGAIMLLVGGLSYLAGGLALTRALLRDRGAPAPSRRKERDVMVASTSEGRP